MRSLRGKRVLITGGAQGIGRETALRMAREGADILVVDLRRDQLPAVKAEIERLGVKAYTYVLDVTDFDSIPELRDRIHADVGPIDVLVNNAGTVYGGAFLEVPWDKHALTYNVNTLGVAAMAYYFLPDLLERPEGHLVNIASAAGLVALPFGSTYASSKWSVIGLSESIRLELRRLGKRNVGVTCVCPSVVNTTLFTGTTPAKTTQVLDPAYLADKICRAVLRNKPFVMEPFLVRTTPFLRGVLPLWLFDRVGEWFGASRAMETWRGHTRTALEKPHQPERVGQSAP